MRERSEEHKSRRHAMVTHLVRNELSQILRREVKDPRVNALTITDVIVKPDMKSAAVHVCKFQSDLEHNPTAEEKAELMKGLESAQPFVYRALKKRLVMKVIPSVTFYYDERLAAVTHVWNLLQPTSSAADVEGES
jgi:ribosome-binding factor A